MTIEQERTTRITVLGVGGAGGNAVDGMIGDGLAGVGFMVVDTDFYGLTRSKAQHVIRMELNGLCQAGFGCSPDLYEMWVGEVAGQIRDHLSGVDMLLLVAGLGGCCGTAATPAIARIAREMGIFTVGVVTKPYRFEGNRRMRMAERGRSALAEVVDTLLILPNEKWLAAVMAAKEDVRSEDMFRRAAHNQCCAVACVAGPLVKGVIGIDFDDVCAVLRKRGNSMMGIGEAAGIRRAAKAAEAAIASPWTEESSMKDARDVWISVTGGRDLDLTEVDEAVARIREEADREARIVVGATIDGALDGLIRVSVIATGMR